MRPYEKSDLRNQSYARWPLHHTKVDGNEGIHNYFAQQIRDANISGFFGRTLVPDTLRTKVDSASFKTATVSNDVLHYGGNSFQVSPETCWQVFPDTR